MESLDYTQLIANNQERKKAIVQDLHLLRIELQLMAIRVENAKQAKTGLRIAFGDTFW